MGKLQHKVGSARLSRVDDLVLKAVVECDTSPANESAPARAHAQGGICLRAASCCLITGHRVLGALRKCEVHHEPSVGRAHMRPYMATAAEE